MTEVNQEIREQIKQAVTAGDLKRLKSLANQFPESFASFGGGQKSEDNLVDSAWKEQKHDVLIWLVLEKGMEASARLKANPVIAEYRFADPQARYHKTAEVLVASIANKNNVSGHDCRSVQSWATYPDLGLLSKFIGRIDKQFVHQVQSGNFRKFVVRMASDDRVKKIETAHSAAMFVALAENIDKIEERFREAQIERNKLATPNTGRRPS
jgi:hypothetical protein